MWDYVIGGVTLWAALFGLIMFYNGRVTRKALGGILERMERNQERMLKNQEYMLKDHEVMITAFKKAFGSRSPKTRRKK